MTKTIHTDAPEVRAIAAIAFPPYHGKTFQVQAHSVSMRLDSCWSGGSRSFYAVVDMVTGRNISIPENGTPFCNGGQIFTIETLPANIAIVEHCIFCGKDMGIRIYVAPENLNKFALPATAELTLGQQIVLAYTRARKSSYNGRNRQQMALEESGLAQADWEQAKAQCVASGWLNKMGAITDAGRNVIGDVNPESLQVPGFNRYAWMQ